jgi:hypothetical protein
MVVRLPDHAGLTDSDFAVNFWSNFWADLIVAIPIAGGIAWLTQWRKAASARIYCIARPQPDRTLVPLSFYISNTGQIAFRSEEIYWVVFASLPGPKLPVLANDRSQYNTRLYASYSQRLSWQRNLITVQTYRGILKTPLFHGRRLRLFTVDVEPDDLSKYKFWYYLSTPHGILPKGVKVPDEGSFPIDSFPEISMLIHTRASSTNNPSRFSGTE